MSKRFALCFLLALALAPWLAWAQTQPGVLALSDIAAPETAVTFDGTGQVNIAMDGKVLLDFWSLVMLVLTPLVPALAAHFSPWISSNRPWMKIIDLIAGNYLAARNDPRRQ